MRPCNLNHAFFAHIATESQAYWLGFLTADGCICGGNKVAMCLSQKDQPHLEAFRDAVSSSHAITVVSRRVPAVISGRQVGSVGSLTCALSFRSNQMVADLANLGIGPRKSLNAAAWVGPSALMRHYWRGLVDGDGTLCVERAPRVALVGSSAVVEAFCEWGRSVSGSAASVRPKGKIWQVEFGYAHAKSLASALYEGASVFLPRKKVIADAIVSRRFQTHRPAQARVATISGVTKPVADWCRELRLKYHSVCQRIRKGWDPERAITTAF